ncbi:MAG: RNA-directed DNA polymerase (Reverse transcriptase) [Candidatus Uhrbacteria bacterium GW2011_GWD2_41_121]|uniref:RNA-directed DNA polymerase (Reverse transcriptase) n=1 Tax=Candidatus Uhrbacteria bacterium GW2011_GWC1_41_20 TaxID=1618983 RepID=A0A0G0VBJ5_9BACT|nr:MAG: RNA-directed DNA polymerase (Reverse transcriptase) [Candidatus Uhrbacteria bacterium GW2011_GWE1_39_46]KKR63538.1 MAG: RNA-directed DNA polymerase (Reverse transcriptase) [Candidatus Uhrbacteria bacterium GW2011_GWC2_40_450]KKR89732.1 MAG: RNA-directed DNA polymerase (Reverse transcriptase) [Candidatus Uhrbacteria bacterium GW2011_GWD2_41_121]KKR98293.1 MAG: RNA-directed DNA polymerase (Reverse transcriptase) [Candidatus Uhrbacteria bacterium GW2011_GWC1_41_20]KKS05562.1 MAG: RNA-direc
MNIKLLHSYDDIICLDNLYLAWQDFVVGKRNKFDVQQFDLDLITNIDSLHSDLVFKTYSHGGYYSFYINDPKRRHIHKADVRDRLLHHAIYRLLYPFFEKTFISDSYSCRIGKGVYKAIDNFYVKSYKVSKNNTKSCWVLKCDIRKFFASIDHGILLDILDEYIPDKNIVGLLADVIDSYHNESTHGIGLPLGNLTSQLFANIYMNVFDQWVKHKLKARHYIRYADDFVIISDDREWLEGVIDEIRDFLFGRLNLSLHPTKIYLKTLESGVDFLGWILFPKYRLLRKKTKQRMFEKLLNDPTPEVVHSYLGLLVHGNTYDIQRDLLNCCWQYAKDY